MPARPKYCVTGQLGTFAWPVAVTQSSELAHNIRAALKSLVLHVGLSPNHVNVLTHDEYSGRMDTLKAFLRGCPVDPILLRYIPSMLEDLDSSAWPPPLYYNMSKVEPSNLVSDPNLAGSLSTLLAMPYGVAAQATPPQVPRLEPTWLNMQTDPGVWHRSTCASQVSPLVLCDCR